MAGLKKLNVINTTLSGTVVAASCVCVGSCWAGTDPKKVETSWFNTSKKASITKTVSAA